MPAIKPLTIKGRSYLNAYAETQSLAKAGLKVNPHTTMNTAGTNTLQVTRRDNVVARLEQVFDAVGLTEVAIANKLKDKTEAKRQIFFSHQGIVIETREVDDNHTQLKATEMAAKLRGMEITRHASLNIAMTGEDIRQLRNDELNDLLAQCDVEISKLEK